MNRAIISQRITSILAEIERLNNALYAMNTTDIQRYPDNYEVLSTDAALRAERITCRLRHLIYATTSIKKEDYLRSAETMQGLSLIHISIQFVHSGQFLTIIVIKLTPTMFNCKR